MSCFVKVSHNTKLFPQLSLLGLRKFKLAPMHWIAWKFTCNFNKKHAISLEISDFIGQWHRIYFVIMVYTQLRIVEEFYFSRNSPENTGKNLIKAKIKI